MNHRATIFAGVMTAAVLVAVVTGLFRRDCADVADSGVAGLEAARTPTAGGSSFVIDGAANEFAPVVAPASDVSRTEANGGTGQDGASADRELTLAGTVLDAAADRVLGGATVDVVPAGWTMPWKSTRTAGDGSFEFVGLVPNRSYRVIVRPGGGAIESVDLGTLGAGREVREIAIRRVEILRGRVLDSDSRTPVGSVTVRFDGSVRSHTVRTGSDGAFVIRGEPLEDGAHATIAAAKEGCFGTTRTVTFGATGVLDGVDLFCGRYAEIHGRAVDRLGAPLKGVAVRLHVRESNGERSLLAPLCLANVEGVGLIDDAIPLSRRGIDRDVTTDADGMFHVGGLPHGFEGYLRISGADGMSVRVDFEPIRCCGELRRMDYQETSASSVITGRLTFAGEARPGTIVARGNLVQRTVRADAEGAFRIEGLPAGMVELTASLDVPLPPKVVWVEVVTDRVIQQDIDIPARFEIRGTARRLDRTILVGARIVAIPVEPGDRDRELDSYEVANRIAHAKEYAAQAITDDKGRFELTMPLADVEYLVSVLAPSDGFAIAVRRMPGASEVDLVQIR